MKFTITSDPVDQYNGRGTPGRYDAEFARLTPKNNCFVFDDFSEMEKVAQAMDGSSAPSSPAQKSRPPRPTKQTASPAAGWCFRQFQRSRRPRSVEIFRSENLMTAEEIVKAAYDAGFSSSEMHQRLAEFKRLIESAAAAEREECAKVCDYQITRWTDDRARYASSECAAGIRARGNP